MPLPLLLIPLAVKVIAVGAGAVGVGAGVKAAKDISEAKSVESRAKDLISSAETKLNNRRVSANKTLESLGRKKLEILSSPMKDFVCEFEKIKNITLEDSVGIDELRNLDFSKEQIAEMKNASAVAGNILVGGAASLGSGALAAYGAYAGVMAFGKASTGIAIAKLSGVAATKATLAWLGGGALAAGGQGIAGGMIVLGGIVAGPALAIGGIVMSSQANKRLNDAYSNLSQASVIAKEMSQAELVVNSLRTRSIQTIEVLNKLNRYFITSIANFRNIILEQGTNWSSYNQTAKESIFAAAKLAQTIKVIIDTSLLEEDGSLAKKYNEVLQSGRKYLVELANQ